MFKAKNKTLPDGVHRSCKVSDSKYELRVGCKLVLPKAKKEVKRRYISFKEVQLWNSADLNLKQCTTFVIFKNVTICTYIWELWL